MSDEPRPPKFKKSENYCRFGVERLAKLLESLESQISGVIRNEDTECIHRMRVASRRMRAAMPLFRDCFPKKKYKKWLKEIKEITRLLGNARDLDVQIALIRRFRAKNEAEAGIADLLLKSHNAMRAKIQPDIERTLHKLKDSGVVEDMQEFFRHTAIDLQSQPLVLAPVLEKAYWNVAYRIDDFLAMEHYVHQENEVIKHHEMRIRAKWLRYTMETYSQLYESKLVKEIEVMKSYQDLLGEMHDCDVLTEYTRDFTAKTKCKITLEGTVMQEPDLEPSLISFLKYLKEQRRIHYTDFVNLWESDKKSGFFKNLRETIRNGVLAVEDIINELETKRPARIAVLADAHANLHALRAVVEDAEKRGIGSFLNAGDLIGYGPYPEEVIELLRSKKVISIVGNVDLEVFQGKAKGKEEKIVMEFARKQTSKSCRTYLLSLPRCVRLEINGKKIFMTHGSPESIDEHLYPETSLKRLSEIAEGVEADIIITGHSHVQYVRELSGVFFLDPGSVGRPGDGNPQASYAIVGFNPLSFELVRVEYDVAAAAESSRKRGLPESFSQMLLRGVALRSIVKEDHKRKTAEADDCQKITRDCRKISKEYWPDTEHYEQVRKLSLQLFDELRYVHKLGRVERCWLECSSILHDIGLSKGAKGHHKKTMKLILNDTRLIFPSEERRIIASIAKYHRKSFPSKKNYNLAALSSSTIQKITVLSGILRTADSLDCSHNRIVQDLRLRVGKMRIAVECKSGSDTELEQRAFMKKKDLMEKALNRRMVLRWERQ